MMTPYTKSYAMLCQDRFPKIWAGTGTAGAGTAGTGAAGTGAGSAPFGLQGVS